MQKSWTEPGIELKVKLGDQVHINKSHCTFKKGYLPSRTEEIFTVTGIVLRCQPAYVNVIMPTMK